MHILIGALVGAVFAVGMTVGMSLLTGRKPQLKHVLLAALGGAVSGAVASATLGAGGFAAAGLGRQALAFGMGGAVGGGTERAAENAVEGRDLRDGVGTASAMGATTGLVSLGVTRGTTALLRNVAPPSATPPPSLRSRFIPSRLLRSDVLRRFVEAPTPGSGSGALRVWQSWRDTLQEREWFQHQLDEPLPPTPGMIGALQGA